MELYIIHTKNHQAIMVIMAYMETMIINIMQINIFMNLMIMIRRNNIVFLFLILLSGCSLSPGMHMSSASSSESVFIESLDKEIKIQNISISQPQGEELYRIGNGDQIAITVWGLPDLFSHCKY